MPIILRLWQTESQVKMEDVVKNLMQREQSALEKHKAETAMSMARTNAVKCLLDGMEAVQVLAAGFAQTDPSRAAKLRKVAQKLQVQYRRMSDALR